MIIKRIAVGNVNEAYIETALSDSFNVISSDDNNKGKTIIIQSLMYCLGNIPIFPSTFNYKDYYHIVEFSNNSNDYVFCRKDNTYIIRNEAALMVFDSVSEMKRYWSKHIFKLPQIIKNDIERIVDPELFVQLFFIGQDKKDTSNIANKGFYKKEDFFNMLYSLMGLGAKGISIEEISIAKNRILELKDEKATLQKQYKILKKMTTSVSYLSANSDKIALALKIKNVEKIKKKITSIRVLRNSAINRKVKYEVTLKELNSLNRTINSGEVLCLDCNSTHIGFRSEKNSSYTFDISTPEIRKQIIGSIKEKIAAYNEDIERYTGELNSFQERLQQLLSNQEISLESIVAYKKDFFAASDAEIRITEIDEELKQLNDAIRASQDNTAFQMQMQHKLMNDIISKMNEAYKRIDVAGNLKFNSLFTKRDQVFSGSEATVFHLLKLYAIAKILNHTYPIIVDSFRAEDLSTDKEQALIDLFAELGKQIIFTTTLKIEEIGKYDNRSNITHIDYSSHAPSKMLNKSYVTKFLEMTEGLSLTIK